MSTYVANIVDTNSIWHTVRVQATDYRAAKVSARKVAKAQGVSVKFINDIFVA